MVNSESSDNTHLTIGKSIIRVLSWIYIIGFGLWATFGIQIMPYLIIVGFGDLIYDHYIYHGNFLIFYEPLIQIASTGVVVLLLLPGFYIIGRCNPVIKKDLKKRLSWSYVILVSFSVILKHNLSSMDDRAPMYVYYGDYATHYLVDWFIIYVVSLCPGLFALWRIDKQERCKITWRSWAYRMATVCSILSVIIFFLVFLLNILLDAISNKVEMSYLKYGILFVIFHLPAIVFLWFSYRRRRLRQKA